jgi:hypothetical protein
MRKKHAPGCPCCACNGNITVVVVDQCGVGISGASVTVKQGGVTIGTCTTDATGTCSVPITLGGVYDITVTSAGYGSGSGTVTVSACSGGTVGGYIVITLTKTGGPWVCCPTGCSPNAPIPTTLSLSGGVVTSLSLVYNGMASQGLANTWAACTTYTSAYILKDCGCTPGNPGGPFSTPLVFKLRCPLAGRVWTLEIDYCGCFNTVFTNICGPGSLRTESCGTYSNWYAYEINCSQRHQPLTQSIPQDSVTSCNPFHFVGTISFPLADPSCATFGYVHPLSKIFPAGTTFTITP